MCSVLFRCAWRVVHKNKPAKPGRPVGLKGLEMVSVWEGYCRKSNCYIRLMLAVIVWLVALLPVDALALTCTSNVSGSGNWGSPGSWTGCGGGIPGASDTAVISGGDTINANVNITVGAVTINSTGTLNIANRNWTVNGATAISGTLAHTSTNGTALFLGMVTVNPGGTWNNSSNESVTFGGGITNNGTWNNGTGTQIFSTLSQVIAGSNSITFGGDVDIGNGIVVTNSNTNVVTINGVLDGGNVSSTWVNSTGSTLNYFSDSTVAPMDTGTLLASANANTVIYSRTASQTVKAATYHYLVLSGSGTKTLATGTTVNSDLTTSGTSTMSITTGGTVTINGNMNLGGGTTYNPNNGATIRLRGNLNNNASTFDATSSTFIFDGTSTQAISGATSFNNLTIANTAAAVSTNNNITATGTLTIDAGAVLSPAAGTTVDGGTLAGSGTARVTYTGTASDFGSQYTIGANAAALSSLTIEYAGAAAQTVTNTTYGGLTINTSGGATLAVGTTTVNGLMTLNAGTLAVGAQTLILNGPAIAGTPTNLTTTSSSNLTFGGGVTGATGVEMPSSVAQLNNLTVNNTNGISLNSSPTVSGALTLTLGAITTGTNVLITSSNCPASVIRPGGGGYVLGKLRLTFPSGNNVSCTFHVGSSTAYAPMGVTVNSGGGTLTGHTTGNEHAQIALSGIDSTKDANRYWTLGATEDTINVSLYGITFSFITADVDISATATNFKVGKYAGSGWSLLNPSSALSNSTSISSVAGPIAKPTDFAIGESAQTCDVPAGLPSNMSCVCDNFGRATLNPSTIFGGNWAVSTSGGSFGVPRIASSGYLRMTDNSGNAATAATMPGTFPAAGNLITVEFKHYAYNAAGSGGADGIALTLSDAATTPVPGAYGGSLGYAQKDNAACSAGGRTPPCNGFVGGWVGIGVDEWGNFSAATEGRSGGPAQRPDSVAVRGSGSGLTGYSYLAGTAANLSPPIDSPTLTSPNPGHAYRIIVDARNYTWNGSTGNKTTLVSVDRDTTGTGNSYSSLVSSFDAYVVNPSQAPVPTNWKLSFTGSTGSAVNYHEIAGLKICAQTITPPAGYRIEIDNLAPSTCGTPGGNPSSPVITVTAVDTNGNTVNTYTNTVTLSATLIGGGASAAVWAKKPGSANGVLSGNQYTFDPTDFGTAKFYLTDASSQDVQITVAESGGSIASSTPLDTPIQYRGGMFTVEEDDSLDYDVVGGRPHTMKITRTTCTGGAAVPDPNFDGMKSLDGWYTPDANHPTGAVAPQICTGACTDNDSCRTLSIAAPNVNAGSNNLPALDFVDGVAHFCLRTADVGKYWLFLRDDSIVSAPVTGASPVLTVRPFAVAVSNVNASGVNNPAANSAAGSVFTTAGTTFSATVQGYLWSSDADAADSSSTGTPANADWGKLSIGGIASHYADTVVLASDVIEPAGGAGSASATVTVTGGTGTTNTLSFANVGSFTLKATYQGAYSGKYLGTTGPDLLPYTVFFTKPDSPAQTAWVGRFRPHHFKLSDPILLNRSDLACSPASAFTYMGERMQIGFKLTAMAEDGVAITTNYAGDDYARLTSLTTAAWTDIGANNTLGVWMNATGIPAFVPTPPGNTDTCTAFFGKDAPWNTTFTCTGTTSHSTVAAPSARVNIPTGTIPSITWAGGQGVFATDIVLDRGARQDGPYGTAGTSNFGSFNIGIWPKDEDGTTLGVAADMDGDGDGGFDRRRLDVTTQLRFGRLRLSNANGSELLNLHVPVEAQFWNGSSFIGNGLDSCTTIPGASIEMGSYLKNLAACETAVPANVTLTNGTGRITLPAPGAGNNGSVDLTLFLGPATVNTRTCTAVGPLSTQIDTVNGTLGYLQGNWRGAPFVNDPTARATFGVFRSGPVIYFREIY